jgi:hypothetical protein
LFQTFAAKVEGKLENIWPRSKYETTFLTTFYIQIKGQSIITKNISPFNISKKSKLLQKIFSGLFSALFAKCCNFTASSFFRP